MSLLERAMAGVKAISPYQGGKPIEEVARERNLDPESIVKLASNENPLGPPPAVTRFLSEPQLDLARYPDGNGYRLREAIAAKLSVNSDQVVIGNGSNDVLELVARTFLGEGRSSVFSQHAFAVYPLATLGASAKPISVPAVDWGHDLDAMLAAIEGDTRVVFAANPNNPTGTWLKKEPLYQFLKQVPQDVVVVLDEAYFEYITDPDYPDGLMWLDEFPNLIVTRTFSKIYGLAGLRVGYGVMSPDLADMLNRVRQPFNVNAVAQEAAIIALNDEDYLKQAREANASGMDQLEQGLSALGISYIPSAGNFISFYVGDEVAVNDSLLNLGVIVRPCFGYEMPGYLRVSIGTEGENRQFLEALEKCLKH